MSAILGDPFPHGALLTASANPLPVPARALWIFGWSGAATITVITVSGETLTIALGTPTAAGPVYYLPLQIAYITTITNCSVIGLWH